MHIAVSYGGLSQVPAAFKLTLVEGTEMASRRHLAARGCGLMHEARSSGRPWPTSRFPAGAKDVRTNQMRTRPLTLDAHNKNTNKTTRCSPPRWSVAFADLSVPRVLGSTLQRGRHTASIVSSVHIRVVDENPAVESSAVAQQHRPALTRLKLSVCVQRAM